MAFLIRQISFTADGREIVRPREIDKPVITIGRQAECDVHLQDLSVAPEHARVQNLDNRRITVTSSTTLEFELDGRPVTTANIDSAKGAEMKFGSHRLTVSHDNGNIVISVVRVEALSDASEERSEEEFSLEGLLPSKRLMSWVLSIAVLLAFLAVPIFSYAFNRDDTRDIREVAKDRIAMDASWSSGKLSAAHHGLEGKCEACHTKAFVSVRDDACVACHTDVHDHADPVRLEVARQEPGFGGSILAGFAKAFGKPEQGCVDCHTEHEGAGPMQPTASVFCTDCHADMNSRLIDTKVANVSDFGTGHPQFRPAVMMMQDGKMMMRRVSLDNSPTDDSGLKFPHKLHLAKNGGVARMAQSMKAEFGFGDAMACADCHKPTQDGVRFEPIDMKRDCQMCHSLGFETIGGTVRTLRHGEPKQVIADIRAFYRSTGPVRPMQLDGMVRRQPGEYAAGKTASVYYREVSFRPGRAEDAIRAVFSKGGACFDCHNVTPAGVGGASEWTVQPVRQTSRFLTKGWFSHDAHKDEKCESCHKADGSNKATDVLLPGVAVCRDCHGGENAKADVPSSCALCHSFHAGDGAPWSTKWRVAKTKTGTEPLQKREGSADN